MKEGVRREPDFMYSIYRETKLSEKEKKEEFIFAHENKNQMLEMMDRLAKEAVRNKNGHTYFMETYNVQKQKREENVERSKIELLGKLFKA